MDEFEKAETVVIASSPDMGPAQRAFAEHCGVNYLIGAGYPNHEAAKALGVFNPDRGSYKRVSFVIDKAGVIQEVIEDREDVMEHPADALKTVQSWQ
ncbi:MAG: redoxin domain-containing protein [SAR202 cluster bacterium]|nr:redoxin domain-containing protein [SAR202 cluster bacterium]